MANIKSAKKRIKIISKRTLRNKSLKSRAHTYIVKVLNSKDKATALEYFPIAIKYIDINKSKGIYHKNNAARKKSRLAKFINRLS